jgi:AraC-like DNA-binding protein
MKDLGIDDSDPIEQLLLDVEQRLGVVITIHDHALFFRDVGGERMLARHRARHCHPYCLLGRYRCENWDQHCLDHCYQAVNAEAIRLRKPFVHLCWKGVEEVVVPVMREGTHLFTIFAGAFRRPGRWKAPVSPAFPADLLRAYKRLPPSDSPHMKSIARILRAFGEGLTVQVDRQRFGDRQDGRKTRIQKFLHDRSHEPVGLEDLAKALSLSVSRTSHLVRELFGTSYQDLLIKTRITRARILLTASNHRMAEVARRVGIRNEYYFSRLFRARVGIPPGQFRRENQKMIS